MQCAIFSCRYRKSNITLAKQLLRKPTSKLWGYHLVNGKSRAETNWAVDVSSFLFFLWAPLCLNPKVLGCRYFFILILCGLVLGIRSTMLRASKSSFTVTKYQRTFPSNVSVNLSTAKSDSSLWLISLCLALSQQWSLWLCRIFFWGY